MVKIKNTGFIGLLSCVVTFFLRAKFSTPRKLSDLSLLGYHIAYLFTRFGSAGKELLLVLQHLLRLYGKTNLEIPPRRETIEALIAASKFGDMSNRKYLLSVAAELQKDPEQTDLRAMIVYRESVLLRFSKKISDSQRVIQRFLDRPVAVANPRLHALFGLLHLSQAENWAYEFNYRKVYEEAQKWEPGNSPTAMQLYVLRTKLSVLGQSYKGNGLFEDAKSAFEGCLAAMKPHDSERYLIKSNLADICCELDYLKRKKSRIPGAAYLEEAEKIVSPEIERIRGRSSRHFRRLLLSLAEIEILRGRHSVAESLIKELLAIYSKLTEHDTNDQVGHVRALIAWARISAPSEAVVRWHNACHWNKIYNPSEEDVFTCGVIYLFISLAYFKLGNADESWASFNRAAEIVSRKKVQFLIPGVGTYLYDFAWRELWSVAGWLLPGTTL
jgi:tetratricopeptide (TPR) repeat protein